MNCCAVSDHTIWGYLLDLGNSVEEACEEANSVFATTLHNRGWSDEKIEMSGSEEFADAHKAAKDRKSTV